MDRVSWGPVKGLRLAVAAFLISLVLVLAVAAISAYLLTHRANEGSETHSAICALVQDLESRTEQTKGFLLSHPEGIPGLATPAQLREQLTNQERTLNALGSLSC